MLVPLTMIPITVTHHRNEAFSDALDMAVDTAVASTVEVDMVAGMVVVASMVAAAAMEENPQWHLEETSRKQCTLIQRCSETPPPHLFRRFDKTHLCEMVG